jgi:MYXO-CTERM domain-containing protein
LVVGGIVMAGIGMTPRSAGACGCFTPPDPSVPVVQAGERILFAMQNGQVTAHIQIQYSGDAKEFGWILPLPSVPNMDLGTDELFNQLISNTQPKYRLQTRYQGNCGFANRNNFGGATGAPAPSAGGQTTDSNGQSPLVIQDSIGPYDYAVLHADNKDAMLGWLSANHYFVPVGTDDTVAPYIRPGAYFLALKLRSGSSAGDLQPVVVKYASDLPMIPIVLTSVAAKPDMGIQVWMLGSGRAIPRNYFHTIINDAFIDWQTAGRNYNDVIIRAVGEAPGKHSFVTEYAGASNVMRNVLNYPNRFGSLTDLQASPDAISFVEYLQSHGFPFSSQLVTILTRYIPEPAQLTAKGVTALEWLQSLSYYLTSYRQQFPDDFTNWPGITYQPAQMAADLNQRIIQPTLAAGGLFDQYNYLTRLYTTLSPQDMNKDPVFSFNVGLPGVNNVHNATLTYLCNIFAASNDQATTPAELVTEQGWRLEFPVGTGVRTTLVPSVSMPSSAGIEILPEEGNPQVVADNTATIRRALGMSTGGCAVAGDGAGPGAAALLALVALGLGLLRRRARA